MPGITIDILWLLLGIALLIGGGESLVRGAGTIARRLGVPPLVVGLTIVAFGTSAPELALNVIAALNDNPGLSFGNIVGSNIANVGLILGIAALVRPLAVNAGVVRRELPLMVLATLVMVALGTVPIWDDAYVFGRIDGIVLLAGFVLFVSVTLVRAKAKMDEFELSIVELGGGSGGGEGTRPSGSTRSIVLVVVGFVLLAAGGFLAERGASGIARGLGMSDELIGLTIVALATSLPELVTSVVAVRRGQIDIAVGNVVGSNLFNLLLVLGVTTLITDVPLPETGLTSLFVMTAFAVVLIPMSRTHGQRLSRAEGAALLACYVGYMAYEVWRVLK